MCIVPIQATSFTHAVISSYCNNFICGYSEFAQSCNSFPKCGQMLPQPDVAQTHSQPFYIPANEPYKMEAGSGSGYVRLMLPRIRMGLHSYSMTCARILGNGCSQFGKTLCCTWGFRWENTCNVCCHISLSHDYRMTITGCHMTAT